MYDHANLKPFGRREAPPQESRLAAEERLIAEMAQARAKGDTAEITRIHNALNRLFD